MKWWYLVPAIIPCTAAPLAAQTLTAAAAAQAALAECVRFTEDGALRDRTAESKAAAERAEQAHRVWLAADGKRADALAGLGIVQARCQLPHAGMATIMNVVENATQSLQAALDLDPKHWEARFTLAMVYFNMPSFLNKTADAIRELEVLRAQQGASAERPHYALVWLRLGDAYQRAGRRSDAQAAYAAGAKLFPAHEELQRKAAEAGAPAPAQATSHLASPSPDSPPVYALAPLRIEAAQAQLEEARSSASLRRMDIYMMPGGTGEMLQTLQSLPGTTRAGDGADLYVRGGDSEETPIFVNGGRMAFPGRWEGLNGTTMGVLDANVLSKAYFSAGGFSAKYGNALSGVVDVESQGRPSEARWRAGVNLVSLGASLHRPLGERAGVWGTTMLTDVTLLARTQGQAALYPDMPRSYQAVVGGSYLPAVGLELKAVGLVSGDESSRLIDAGGHHGAFESSGSTQHGALSARWLRADGRAGVHASATASRRSSGFRFGVLERDRIDRAYGLRLDGDVVSVRGARLRGGLEATRFEAEHAGRVPVTGNVAPGAPARELAERMEWTTHVGGYLEAEHSLPGGVIAVAGLRADRLAGDGEVSLDPRAALAYTSGSWTMRAGAGLFHQSAWRRRYQLPDAGAPSGVPTRARHVVLGVERTGEPSFKLEAYDKQYDAYAAGDGGGPAVAAGAARGVDALVRWQRQARLNGWLTYSLLDADVELESGAVARARYDVTHSLTAVARFALSERWELGSTLRYATGKPYTPVTGATASDREGWPLEPVYGEVHGERLPYYGRIDGRITRYQPIGGNTGVFYLEMIDLTGRRNVIGYQYDAAYRTRKPMDSFFARRTFVLGAEFQF